MVGDFVKDLIRGKVDEARGEVWERDDLFFFVDWREEEENIPVYCDALIGPGLVSATWSGEDLVFACDERSVVVPLTHSPADRHIALLSLNEVLAPRFEVRFVWASTGADTVALLPLPAQDWQSLLNEHGAAALDRAFMKLQQAPNVFTDPLVRPEPEPERKSRWRFW
jgi:hypothetical protein